MTLFAIAALYGVAAAWVFARTTDTVALTVEVKRILAALMEFRLFGDEPSLIWRAQAAVIRGNFKLLKRLLPAILTLALPSAWLFAKLDDLYGWSPLKTGETAVVTVQLDRTPTGSVNLSTPAGVQIEAGPIRIFEERQVSWRIRAARATAGELLFRIDGQSFAKKMAAGERTAFTTRRSAGEGDVNWLEVDYPRDSRWVWWFFFWTAISALVFTRTRRA